jgi:valyl-tRNA synthetase
MCDKVNHPLIEIYRSGSRDEIYHVVRWCIECGAIVIDKETKGKLNPGAIMEMRFVLKDTN